MSTTGARTDSGQHSDDQTREQVRSRLDANLFLEAGAGTGKTDALVTRLSELLASGKAQPDEIAAITFTRAAAFEMRSRLRAALEADSRLRLELVEVACIALLEACRREQPAQHPTPTTAAS